MPGTIEQEQDETGTGTGTPDLSRSERIFVRISIWQTILSVAGVFTGAVALYAALNESEAVRRQSAAAVWPYIQLTVSDYANQDGAAFGLSLTNSGVGPAKIRNMRVTIGGVHVTGWRDAIEAAGGDRNVDISRSTAQGRVLRPGERIELFSTTDRQTVTLMQGVVADGASAIEYCYCSIFDECWLINSREQAADPQPVDQCPAYGKEAFGG